MANFIPRLEWNFKTLNGSITNGSNSITGIASTTGVVTGMLITHASFPAGTTVSIVGANSLTLSVNATASAAASNFTLFERFDFTYPSSKQAAPKYKPTESISESVSGKRQIQINNIIKKLELEFRFLTSTQVETLEARFYETWAVLGKAFRYYESKDVNTYENYELDSLDFDPTRAFPKAQNFLYTLPLKFRRIYL